MNAQIQEYMANAERDAQAVCGFCNHPDYNKIRNEKFAELIVRECVTRIQGCHLAEGYYPGIDGEFEFGYKKGIDKAANQVLLHFGIDK